MDDAVRAQIRELLETGLPTEQVARQLGVSKGTVSAVKAHLTMGTYVGSPAGPLSETDVEEIEDAADLKFGLKRDMQAALRRSIDQLDPDASDRGRGEGTTRRGGLYRHPRR